MQNPFHCKGHQLLVSLKDRGKKLPFYGFARALYRRFQRAVPRHPLQDLKTEYGYPLKHLGTGYGGWTFVDDPKLFGSTIISAGLGEDASFDIEFASKYDAKVILVDPTPRAIAHFNEIAANLGRERRRRYVSGGKQPVEAYDLRAIDSTRFTLVPKALWESETTLKFFEPPNPEHVSHSVVNYQNDYSESPKYIDVESITLTGLLAEIGLSPDKLGLIKLDIEGAEVEVLCDFLGKSIHPAQILVEFDELNAPSPKAFERIDRADETLRNHGYKCIHTDGQTNFLYIRTPNRDV